MSVPRMQIGIGALPTDFTVYPEWARTAEACGFDLIGVGDSSTLWADPFVTLAVAAMSTTVPRLMVMGTNPVTRHPVVAAAAIESVQKLSGGRCLYALGSGDSAVANIGEPRAALAEVEEYGRVVQALCAGEQATYRGHELHVRWSGEPVPVLLCAEGPRTQRLAGRFADGAILYNGLTEEVVSESVANVAAGATEAGRDVDDVELWWPIVFHLADDVASGVEAVKFSLAGTANRAFRHSLDAKLVPAELHAGFRGLQAEYRSSHHQQLGDHSFNASLVDRFGLTGYLAERFAVVGPAAHCAERLEELAERGVRNVTLSLLAQTLPEQVTSMRVIADEVFGRLPR
jgi:5,10-methylenetetrahydromethanopterin reductase